MPEAQQAPPTFTNREREVYELICGGLRTATIAEKLEISAKTVETHRMRINKKLGTHSTREIILRRIVEVAEDDTIGIPAARLAAVTELAKRALRGSVDAGSRS